LIDADYDQSFGEDTSQGNEIKKSGGRPISKLWPEWVAEMTLYIEQVGLPEGTGHEGQSKVIDDIADRLTARGIDSPSRTTVQETVRAVFRRHRSAGN
jgi:hypothetical protein